MANNTLAGRKGNVSRSGILVFITVYFTSTSSEICEVDIVSCNGDFYSVFFLAPTFETSLNNQSYPRLREGF